MSLNPLFSDLESSFSKHPHLLEEIKKLGGSRFFITGGTGFFGCWLLESLAWIHQELRVDLSATVLTRDQRAFQLKRPHLAKLPFLKFLEGDISSFDFPKESFTHFIHAATEASAKLNSENPLLMFKTTLEGTRRALDCAVHCGVKRFLLTSSGAVYGKQPPELSHLSEEDRGGPDPLAAGSAYGEGKRAAEFLCGAYSHQGAIEAVVARCFAFVGPYLALDQHFAIGNFIKDGMRGGPIHVGGDGTPYRSYLYGADLVVWLWGILLQGKAGRAYNVGSEEAVSIQELAHQVAQVISPKIKVNIAKAPTPGRKADRYVPSTRRTQDELHLKQTVSLEDSIRKTVQWNQ